MLPNSMGVEWKNVSHLLLRTLISSLEDFFFFFPDGFGTLKFQNKSALTLTLKNANKLFNNEAPKEESLLKT